MGETCWARAGAVVDPSKGCTPDYRAQFPWDASGDSLRALAEPLAGTVVLSAINPLGFATENFDALGRFRTAQTLFDANGNVTGTKAVNTATVPQVSYGDPAQISSPSELMSLMAASSKVEACLSRHFFRFTYARWEVDTTDGCSLEDSRKALMNSRFGSGLGEARFTTPVNSSRVISKSIARTKSVS